MKESHRCTNGALEAYVCTRCGYCELYVRNVHEVDIEKLRGAKVLRAAETPPFR